MLKEMLSEVEKLTKNKVSNQSKDLIQGVMPKNYIPLLKRQQCGQFIRCCHLVKRLINIDLNLQIVWSSALSTMRKESGLKLWTRPPQRKDDTTLSDNTDVYCSVSLWNSPKTFLKSDISIQFPDHKVIESTPTVHTHRRFNFRVHQSKLWIPLFNKSSKRNTILKRFYIRKKLGIAWLWNRRTTQSEELCTEPIQGTLIQRRFNRKLITNSALETNTLIWPTTNHFGSRIMNLLSVYGSRICGDGAERRNNC